MKETPSLGLREAAEVLGLHYMTVYRHVRTGRMEATFEHGGWRVSAATVERELRHRSGELPGRARPAAKPRIGALFSRLVAGDEAGAYQLLEAALASGSEPASLYLDLLAPALRRVGDAWAKGSLDVADEHRASAVTQRIIGRLGPLFRPRGRRRGSVVMGAVAGDLHAIPSAMVADLVRAKGYDVADLGADVPAASYATAAAASDKLKAVAIVVTSPSRRPGVRGTVDALHAAGVTAPLLVGGSGIARQEALASGADRYTASASQVLDALAALSEAEPRGR